MGEPCPAVRAADNYGGVVGLLLLRQQVGEPGPGVEVMKFTLGLCSYLVAQPGDLALELVDQLVAEWIDREHEVILRPAEAVAAT